MTSHEILMRLLDDLRAIPKCRCGDACPCPIEEPCVCDPESPWLYECPTFGPLAEALMQAENELERGRLITREISEAA